MKVKQTTSSKSDNNQLREETVSAGGVTDRAGLEDNPRVGKRVMMLTARQRSPFANYRQKSGFLRS
jgi:hypothetical protein